MIVLLNRTEQYVIYKVKLNGADVCSKRAREAAYACVRAGGACLSVCLSVCTRIGAR